MLVSLLIVNIIAEVVIASPTLQDISVTKQDDSKSDDKGGSPVAPLHIPRAGWKARVPKDRTELKWPVPYVVVHHSFIPPVCADRTECAYAMRTMQSMHVDQNRWDDIGYNFAVGGDGVVYDGRGWTTLGAHALHFNKVSIGICLVGNYNDTLPSENVLEATKQLIEEGVHLGYISEGYKLVGHRQVRDTECPGQALFDEIKTWPHYDPKNHLAPVLL